jgi:hypothetical protein
MAAAARQAAVASAIAVLAGCASSEVIMVGHARTAIPPDEVRIYLQPPAAYEHIADLVASSRGSFALTSAAKMDKVVERLRSEAAKLGANGVLLHGVGRQSAGSVGAGINTETNSGRSPYGIGFGGSFFLTQKSGDGEAIYVSPE